MIYRLGFLSDLEHRVWNADEDSQDELSRWNFILPSSKVFKAIMSMMYTPPKFNIAPEKWWLEDDPFVLGFGNFSGANC